MSYILEALKKADQERDLGAVPSLATPHDSERPPPRPRRWPWIVALLLGVNAALLGLLLKDRRAEPVPDPVPVVERTVPAAGPSPQAIPPVTETGADEVPGLERIEPPEGVRTRPSGGLVMLSAPTATQSGEAPVQAEPPPAGLGDAMPAAPDAPPLQSWYELPEAFRNTLDLPRLDLHAWSEEPRNRFVLVNLKKYREGESLDSGLLIEEILPDGLVLSYRGERFRVDK